MRTENLRRLAGLGGLLALAMAPGLARAQDGQPESGRPVTNPRTDKEIPRVESSTPPRSTSNQVLPGVPATSNDPAPPGTRSVPANSATAPTGLPPSEAARSRNAAAASPAPGLNGAGAPGAAATGPRSVSPGVMVAEGVVTHLARAGKDVPGELIRFRIDPTRDWAAHVGGAQTDVAPPPAPRRDAAADDAQVSRGRAKIAKDQADAAVDKARQDATGNKTDADRVTADRTREALDRGRLADDQARAGADVAADDPNAARQVELIFTRQSRMFTFARSLEGVDLLGAATGSSPEETSSRSGLTRRPPTPGTVPSTAPRETNFTNIKEGSYVAVRYRRVGDRNVVTNLSLIELPLVDPATTPASPGGTPAAGAPLPR